ncbi:universal stress protein [Streptomyces sp. NPDC018007]|uniref:universal stress protein n=1 Tax=unclassified Streptomyces TaxID=2593676 RepID=UPI0037B8FD84|nr:universal stress protein [Streptomyces sp. NBC_01178]
MPQPVIVGVDGTSDSLLAADWGAREARRQEAPLVLLHGYERSGFGGEGYEDDEAGDLLDTSVTWVRERHEGVEVTGELAVGSETELLVERGEDARMIVLGSRRPGPVTGFFVGSVGLRVLSRAACPVVLIRGGTVSHRPRNGEIVVGVPEDAEEADAVLEFAFRAAATRGAPLRAARAWHLPPVATRHPAALALAETRGSLEAAHRSGLLERLGPWRRAHPEVTVVEHVELGPTAEMLVSLAASAQLLVVGRRSRLGTRYVGHVAHSALHFADAPIALVPTR